MLQIHPSFYRINFHYNFLHPSFLCHLNTALKLYPSYTDSHFVTNSSFEKPILIRYEILKLLCKTRYKKFNIDFWKLLDACSFEAGITYATNFIVPELFKSPQNRYILMPFIEDFSRNNFSSPPSIFIGSTY